MTATKKEAAPLDQSSKRLTRATLHSKTQPTVYPHPTPASESTLDGRLLRTEHGYASYVVVDMADIDGGIPQPVFVVNADWNAARQVTDLEKRCKPIIDRAIAAGATWEMYPREGITTAVIFIPIANLPGYTPSSLTKALTTIEARIAPKAEVTHAR